MADKLLPSLVVIIATATYSFRKFSNIRRPARAHEGAKPVDLPINTYSPRVAGTHADRLRPFLIGTRSDWRGGRKTLAYYLPQKVARRALGSASKFLPRWMVRMRPLLLPAFLAFTAAVLPPNASIGQDAGFGRDADVAMADRLG